MPKESFAIRIRQSRQSLLKQEHRVAASRRIAGAADESATNFQHWQDLADAFVTAICGRVSRWR